MNFLPKKTVDSVLSGFTRLIADLEQVMHDQDAEAVRQRQAAHDAQVAAAAAETEAKRASSAIDKIRNLTT